ncbi:hypothetical protein A2617_00260 [Candidatus Daviesbacteria bacterium RIFOXYD1_FULL_41_10]|uniref:Nucleotide-diphospho-sugar transferase domain-containing protein n=2 Tax=Candidatus Daviesiibacteriota TaxID=1752718 RepID=A0A1F5N035_9BACT|nr:MAG: hypothetical protein UU67_C0015G0003 [Candidatus Daviesbacteria bacterium GW2011_GWB1_41_5]OGE70850.1 MAG: hypothetical protein A2617_00260 [Candidatus Daviesbacteria bacterium RIFOXYD1_FULL_41_10]
MKSTIYYTTNKLDKTITEMVRKRILESGLPIVSCSLEPINFGKNIVLDLEPGPTTMVKQILTALEASESEYVFFCEHDVLYNPTHFDFTPPRKDTFYYNTNVWRWDYKGNKVITYDHFCSVSGLCVSRKKALEHYQRRLSAIIEKGFDKLPGKNPTWARKMGYEPGKKTGELVGEWKSEYPNIDIRHNKTLTPIKMTLESFRHKPTGWRESTIDQII